MSARSILLSPLAVGVVPAVIHLARLACSTGLLATVADEEETAYCQGDKDEEESDYRHGYYHA